MCNSFREFHTLDWFLHVCALPLNRLRRLHVLKDTTQLSCVRWSTSSRSSFQLEITFFIRSPWSFVIFVTVDNKLPYIIVPSQLFIIPFVRFPRSIVTLVGNRSSFFEHLSSIKPLHFCLHSFWTFLSAVHQPDGVRASTLHQTDNHSWSCSTSILEGATFHKWVVASSSNAILARASIRSTVGPFSSGTSGSRCFSLILLHEGIRRRIRLCHFSTLIHTVSETATVSFWTLPVSFALPTISWTSLYALFCPWILDDGVLFTISSCGAKILVSYVLFDTSLHHRFQSVTIRSYFLLMSLQVVQLIPIRSLISQTLVFFFCAILPRCHHAGFSS